MVGGEIAEHLGHAGGNPSVAAAPEEGDIGGVVEEAVGLLELVKIGDHFESVAIEIFVVAGGAVGLELQDGQHIHVVDPIAGLGGEAVGLRVLPLAVGPRLTIREILWVLGLHAYFERDDAEDGVVHMMADGDAGGLGSSGHERGKLVDQALAKRVVVGELSNREGAVPAGAFAVEAGAVALMRGGGDGLGATLAKLP